MSQNIPFHALTILLIHSYSILLHQSQLQILPSSSPFSILINLLTRFPLISFFSARKDALFPNSPYFIILSIVLIIHNIFLPLAITQFPFVHPFVSSNIIRMRFVWYKAIVLCQL